MNKLSLLTCALWGCGTWVCAQNLTDLSVMHNKSADNKELNIGTVPAIDDAAFLHPERIRYNNRCFQIEGKDIFIFSGTFHYFRVPCELWADRFEKLKSAGFNCVETYVPWNWHERSEPRNVSDESKLDMSQLEQFLQMAEEYGLYVILRPGPYICAEWSGGGFPQWLMKKRPKATTHSVWLQSNDPEFMKWNEHWYRAVCRVAAPHQITAKRKGEKGIILFQVENEFNRVNWFPKEDKKSYLEQLTTVARKYGIEVPIITCWTDQSRNVNEGVLNGVVDMVNSYPKWQVEKNFGRLVNMQMRTQPGKPLVSGELQGGWCCELGWPLSWEQDGLPPVQTQNLTLYALERGFGALNFYMAVGGTNFDDWAAREQITSYDYAAAIGEGGVTNERYRRFRGLTDFIRQHGTQVAYADLEYIPYVSSDKEVKMGVRTCANGDRYFFIRTEERSRQHFGTIQTGELTIDFALEPFGSMVYFLPAGASEGVWYPRLPQPEVRIARPLPVVELKCEGEADDEMPTKWKPLKKGESVCDKGIYGRHFVYYTAQAPSGGILEIGRAGKNVVNRSAADTLLVSVDGKMIPIMNETPEKACYQLPGVAGENKKMKVTMLFENRGLHHHTNAAVEKYWAIGPAFVRSEGKDLALSFAYTEEEHGVKWSNGQAEPYTGKSTANSPLLKWYYYSFSTVKNRNDVLYFLKLEHQGNGFIYVNGHCIGRCYQQGAQREYYVPECWLNTDKPNRVAVSLRPSEQGNEVTKALIEVKYKK